MTHTTNTDELDEIFQMAFMGLWRRDPDTNEFMRLDDKYSVLLDSLKQDVREWSNRRTKAIVNEVVETPETAINPNKVHADDDVAWDILREAQRQTAERLLQEGSK